MKYPIGIQSFDKIIEGGYVYVDKTELVYKLVSSGEYYFLSRPRRFGKSLLTSTLEAYFLGRRELFKGLALERLETDWTEYPVFHLDFSGESYTNGDVVRATLDNFLSEKEVIYGKEETEVSFGLRFMGLIKRAYEKTGRKVVVLVDEYDKPLTDTIGNPGLQDANRSLLQGLYGVLKRADAYIKFAFLTGVTRYGKLGIFSAANNLEDISMSEHYATLCGISEAELHACFDEEVQAFADKLQVSKTDMYALLKRKYDGYHFSACSDGVYNPFSLLDALKNRVLENKWFSTGTPTYLARILRMGDFDLTQFNGSVIATKVDMESFGNGEENVLAALYQSGYLTIKDYDGSLFYKLGFPNEEVESGFIQYLMKEFTGKQSGQLNRDLVTLRELIGRNDVDGFMAQIQNIIAQIPFESNDAKLIEANFRNMVYLIISFTGYRTNIEFPTLGGRIDIYFETAECAYIIECKRDATAQAAMEQIDDKKYAEKVSATGKRVVKVGANFSTTAWNLTEWVVGE